MSTIAKRREAQQKKIQGNKAFNNKDYKTALKSYSGAIELDPKNHVLYSNRSACFGFLGRWTVAEADAKKCLELDDTFVKGYARMSTALLELGQPQKAERQALEGLKLDPTNDLLRELRDQSAAQIPGRLTGKDGGGDAYGDHKVDIAYHRQKGIIRKAKGEMLLQTTKLGAVHCAGKRAGMALKRKKGKKRRGIDPDTVPNDNLHWESEESEAAEEEEEEED